MPAEHEGINAIDIAREAAAQFAEERWPGSTMTAAVLLYEVSRIDEDGDITYTVSYSVLTDSSMATAAGVIQLGSDAFHRSVEDEVDGDEQ